MSRAEATPMGHHEAFDLIPWLVSGRLSPPERERLEFHLAECADCRGEVEAQGLLRKAIRRDDSKIEHAPHASFQKLWRRIEESSGDDPAAAGVDRGDGDADPPRAAPSEVGARQRRWMMAAATVLAVGLGLVASSRLSGFLPDRASEYRTVTTPPAQPDRDGQVRVVFSPSVTVEELTRITRETRLTIVGGPSDSGVYTLAVQPGHERSVAEAIARLRNDPRVRFAEPVVAASRGSP